MTTKHGMIGKRNAKKPESKKKLSDIHIRCEPRIKSGAEKTAQESGKTLSKWIIDLIKSNSKY